MADLIPLYPEDEKIEVSLQNEGDFLGVLGSMLLEELYSSEIWQPMPSKPKTKKSKPRRKSGERYVPNYAYKPKGKKPWLYYNEKLEEVGKWLVVEAKDVNYALRVYEGWETQAEKLIAKEEWYHAVLILDVLLWEVSRFHAVHGKDYPKHQSRMRKLEKSISESYAKTMQYSKEKNFNWVEEDLKDLYRLFEREPFCKGEGGFDMQAFIDQALALLLEEKANEFRKAHPSKEDLLRQEIKVTLPAPIPFPEGIRDAEKEISLYDVFSSLPFDEYVSMAESLFHIFLDAEKPLKFFKVFPVEDLKTLKEDYAEFNLIAHQVKPFLSYSTKTNELSYLVNKLFLAVQFSDKCSDKKREFIQELADMAIDVIWRDWSSPAFKSMVEEKQEWCLKRKKLQDTVASEVKAMKECLDKQSEEEVYTFLVKVEALLSKRSKLLCDKHNIVSPFDLSSFKRNLTGRKLAMSAEMQDSASNRLSMALQDFLDMYENLCKVALEEETKDVSRQKYAKKVLVEVKQANQDYR